MNDYMYLALRYSYCGILILFFYNMQCLGAGHHASMFPAVSQWQGADIVSLVTGLPLDITTHHILPYLDCWETYKSIKFLVSCRSLVFLDEDRLVSGSMNGAIMLWNAQSGACVQVFKGHTDWVASLVSLGENRFASGSDDCTVRIWDTQCCAHTQLLKGHTAPIRALSSCGGDRLASGSHDGTIRIWNALSGHCYKTLGGHTALITSLVFLGNDHLACGLDDGVMRIWNTLSGECDKTLRVHTSSTTLLALWGENRVVSASRDGIIRIWDTHSTDCVQQLTGPKGVITALVVLDKDRCAAVLLRDSLTTMMLCDVRSSAYVDTFSTQRDKRSILLVPWSNNRFVACSGKALHYFTNQALELSVAHREKPLLTEEHKRVRFP